MPIEEPTTDRGATEGLPEPVLPDLTHAKHKPVLHIGTAGEKLDEDDLEIDDAELPVMGTDDNRIP
jgi:hypothetical protein